MAAAATEDAPNFQLPPLPKLDGDARYTVLIHPSIANSAAADPADILGSRQRIDLLGKTVLDMVVTHILFSRTPLLSQDNLRRYRERALSDERIDFWLDAYDLRERVIIDPEIRGSLSAADESRALFNAYVGAVYARRGMDATRSWIEALIYWVGVRGLVDIILYIIFDKFILPRRVCRHESMIASVRL